MHKVKHFTLGVAGAAVLATALAFAPAAFAAPSGYFDFTHSYTEDTRIVCGSGASSFDIIDSATVHKYGPSFSDQNGNFVKDILYIDTVGTFSNSVTGTSIQYKSRSIEHDSLAIAGDFNSTFTAVTTGEMNIVASGGGAVWQGDGRVVDTFYPNGDETLNFYGQHDDLVYFFLGETSIADSSAAPLARSLTSDHPGEGRRTRPSPAARQCHRRSLGQSGETPTTLEPARGCHPARRVEVCRPGVGFGFGIELFDLPFFDPEGVTDRSV